MHISSFDVSALNGVVINVITPIRYALPIVYLALTADHMNESREYVVDHLWLVYYIYLFIVVYVTFLKVHRIIL